MNQNIRISFSFNEWLIWFKSKNFNHKVFIFYTLVNPIINLLWSFKVPGFGKSVTLSQCGFYKFFDDLLNFWS